MTMATLYMDNYRYVSDVYFHRLRRRFAEPPFDGPYADNCAVLLEQARKDWQYWSRAIPR